MGKRAIYNQVALINYHQAKYPPLLLMLLGTVYLWLLFRWPLRRFYGWIIMVVVIVFLFMVYQQVGNLQ